MIVAHNCGNGGAAGGTNGHNGHTRHHSVGGGRSTVVKFADERYHNESAVTDLERTASLKGITVLRGRVPNSSSDGANNGENDEFYESYL